MPHNPMGDPIRIEHLVAMDLEPALRRRALELVAPGPDGTSWRHLLDRMLLTSGAGLALAGVVCFFAFNWRGLHRFGKFGLVAAGVCALAGTAWKVGFHKLTGRIALACACVLVGVWLAVFGQAYQTGPTPSLCSGPGRC